MLQRQYGKRGWNLAGDVAYLDNDGHLIYKARADQMITNSGYTISPTEVGRTLLRHPTVVECSVVDQPDDRGGTLTSTHIVLRAGIYASEALTAQLQLHVKSRIAPYNCPGKVMYHADDLPRNASRRIWCVALRCRENKAGSAA
ncbi:AMP-binding enzyme [Burkholderia stabilis]|uniref:AMP-binding enzyme n=1 Tax=Burkholderia stabilis TaxID=95485 RepID=UPI001F0CCC75|nr:hypothetical protein [Burkholderia stabilis]